MENKLGLSDYEIEELEQKLVEVKLSLINYKFTFNTDSYGIDYLTRLHDFLFGDIYYDTNRISNRYEESDAELFDGKIKNITSLIQSRNADFELITTLIQELIDDQIFDDGNSRTISVFFNNFIDAYFDVNDEYAITLKEEIKKGGRKR